MLAPRESATSETPQGWPIRRWRRPSTTPLAIPAEAPPVHRVGEGIKGAVQEASGTAWLAAGKEPPPAFAAAATRYKEEQQEIERDARDLEAAHLFHRHHGFAGSVALVQIAIALGAVAALTRMRLIWFASLLLGLAGAALLIRTFVA